MATQQSIETRVQSIIVEVLCVDATEVTPEATLREDLGADSMDLAELGMHLEEAFDFEMDDADGDALKTVKDVVELVEEKMAKGVQ